MTESPRDFSFLPVLIGLLHLPVMKNEIARRSFLNTSFRTSLAIAGAGLLGPLGARAVEPIKRSGKPRLQLSLAAYSFRQFFTHKDPAKQITLDDFVDYCADPDRAGRAKSRSTIGWAIVRQYPRLVPEIYRKGGPIELGRRIARTLRRKLGLRPWRA